MELVRVTKRGGRIVMGNWILNDPTPVAQILKLSSAYTPPPPPSEVVGWLRRCYGPTMNAFAAAEQTGRVAALQQDLEGSFHTQHQSDIPQLTKIPATFLQVTVAV